MSGVRWTDFEDQFLADQYPDRPTDEIADRLCRSVRSVYSRAREKGYKKTNTYIRTHCRFKNPSEKSIPFRFQKGSIPANKGKRMAEYTTPETRAKILRTAFGKGNLPHNTAKDGDIRKVLYKKGESYLKIRIGLRNWKMLHVYNWEQQYGKVPQGMVVVFKTPDHNNCSYTNLELITRDELMRRNSIHNYPPELKKAMKLTKKLKRLIDGTEQD